MATATAAKDWQATYSLIHAFATLIVLFTFTVNNRFLSILQLTSIYNINGTMTKTVSFYDPFIIWFGAQHTLYAVAALLLWFLVVICPALLLAIYPTRLYGKLFQCLSARKRITIKIFAESVISGFRDGLDGGKDYRMLPGLSAFTTIPLSLITVYPTSQFVFYFMSFMILSVRPCKSVAIMNMSLSFHCMLLGFVKSVFTLWTQDLSISSKYLANITSILVIVPHIVMLIWAGYKVSVNTRVRIQMRKIKMHLQRAFLSCYKLSKRRRRYEELQETHSPNNGIE